jgi:LemA protein
MNRKYSVWIVLGAVIVLFAIWIVGSYNGLVSSKGAVDQAWAQVETQYQRRIDLTPNLVRTVQGSAKFEKSTLTEITDARSAWAQAKQVGERAGVIDAAHMYDSALSRFLVTVENYPDLKTTSAFRDLMTQLEGTENRVAVARRDYNDAVTSYNISVRSFPRLLIARLFGFGPETLFEADEGANQAPEVSF